MHESPHPVGKEVFRLHAPSLANYCLDISIESLLLEMLLLVWKVTDGKVRFVGSVRQDVGEPDLLGAALDFATRVRPVLVIRARSFLSVIILGVVDRV